MMQGHRNVKINILIYCMTSLNFPQEHSDVSAAMNRCLQLLVTAVVARVTQNSYITGSAVTAQCLLILWHSVIQNT